MLSSYLYRVLGLAAAYLTAVGFASAQSLTLQHDAPDTLRQGDAFSVRFGYENLPADDFALPELVGLIVVGGPSQQSSMRMVNGVTSRSRAFTYRVVADQPGLAYIPSISVETPDSTYATDALTVFVTDDPDYVPPAVARGDLRQQPLPPVPPKRRRPTVKM